MYGRIEPCPFCGGAGRLMKKYNYKYRCYLVSVSCEVCGARGKAYRAASDPEREGWKDLFSDGAVMAWNSRTGE